MFVRVEPNLKKSNITNNQNLHLEIESKFEWFAFIKSINFSKYYVVF